MPRAAAPSLKVRALQCLAQREHSRLELRRKLLRHARLLEAACEAARAAAATDAGGDPAPDFEERSPATVRAAAAAEVEAVLDALEADRHLSDARFVESRVNARMQRYGNRRIQQELQQHGTSLDEAGRAQLKSSEMLRARTLWQRRFGHAPAPQGDAAARAKQMRFLAGRGFSPDVIRQVLRGPAEDEEAAS